MTLWLKSGKHPVLFILSPSEWLFKFENSCLSLSGETRGTSTPLASPPALQGQLGEAGFCTVSLASSSFVD